MAQVIKIGDHREPVRYQLDIRHYHDGRLEVSANGIGEDPRSIAAVAETLRKLADQLESD